MFELVTEQFDGTTDVSSDAHIMWNGDSPGTVMSTYEMLNGLADWWESLLSDIGVSEREQFFPQVEP